MWGGLSQPGQVAGKGGAGHGRASEAEGTAWPGPHLPFHLPPYSERLCFLVMRLHPKGHKNCIRRLTSSLSNGKLSPMGKDRTHHCKQSCLLQTQELVLDSCLTSVPLTLPLGTENSAPFLGVPGVRFKGYSEIIN